MWLTVGGERWDFKDPREDILAVRSARWEMIVEDMKEFEFSNEKVRGHRGLWKGR